jgi:hypothetical protein
MGKGVKAMDRQGAVAMAGSGGKHKVVFSPITHHPLPITHHSSPITQESR